MIIKKKRLNKISELGDIPEEQAVVDVQENNDNYSENFQQEVVPEISYSIDSGEQLQQDYSPQPAAPVQNLQDDVDLFNLDNIDFSQRQERRKGDRRRGFRRVDDRNLVSRAREEADAIREAAMKEGYQVGLEQAQADIEQFKNSMAGFLNAPNEIYEYIAPDILEISVDIAQKIIKKEIEQDPQVLFNTIVDVLKTLSKEEPKVTIQVNPAEVNELKQAVPELLNIAGIDTKVIILADEEISEGGCLVTTDNGVVDATIETRINVISEALREL